MQQGMVPGGSPPSSIASSAVNPTVAQTDNEPQRIQRGFVGPESRIWRSSRRTSLDPDLPPKYLMSEYTSCSICIGEFRENDVVCRLNCMHVFHDECWEENLAFLQNQPLGSREILLPRIPSCPNCRFRPVRKLAIWHFLESRSAEQLTQGRLNLMVHYTQDDPWAPDMHDDSQPQSQMDMGGTHTGGAHVDSASGTSI